MNNKVFSIEEKILIIIQLSLVVMLIAFISSSSGCSEDDDDFLIDNLGPKSSFEDVDKAMLNAVKQSTPANMKVGDIVLEESNYRIDVGQVKKFVDTLYYVDGIRDNGDEFEIAYSTEEFVYDDSGNLVEQKPPKQTVKVVAKDNPPIPVNEAKSEQLALFSTFKKYGKNSKEPLMKLYNMSSMADEVVDISFHNLKISKYVTSPPKSVRESSDCRGIPNCRITVTEIRFDLAKWYKSGSKEVERWVVRGSNDTPAYLGAWLNQCRTFILKLEGAPEGRNKVLATFCTVLRDFNYGN